jgi:putative DNA primase/helicase
MPDINDNLAKIREAGGLPEPATTDQGPADNNINIAREAIKLLGDLVYDPETGFFYTYNGTIWQQIHTNYVFKACLDCTDIVRPGKNNESKAKTVMTRVESMSLMERGRTMNDQDGFMSVKNGKFCVDSLKLVDHDRNDYSTQLIDAYVSEMDIELMRTKSVMELDPMNQFPRFFSYLLETFKGYVEPLKTIQYAQELMGYCLVSHCKAQKAFFLVGEGSDGKSVLCEIMTHVIGEDNVTAIPFEGLGNRFDTSALKDKLANISADSNKIRYRENKGTGTFKSIVSGDRIMVEFKGRDLVPITPTATMVMSVNNMPESVDNSHGWRRRINIMPFNNQVPAGKEDRDLADKIIKEEGPALFLFAMQGLQRLKKRGWAFDPCQDSLDATAKYLKGNDPFTRFVNDHVIIQKEADENLSILVDDLFMKFNEWLDDQDMVAPRIDVHDKQSKAGKGGDLTKLMRGRNPYFFKKKSKISKDGKRPYEYLGIDCHYSHDQTDQFDF